MKLKNLTSTIVSVGKTVILPDETKEIADKGYEKNGAIDFLVKTNRLAIVTDEKKPAKKDKKPPKQPKQETPPVEEPKDETPAEEHEGDPAAENNTEE